MQVGTKVKSLKNDARVAADLIGTVVKAPKGSQTFGKSSRWVWVEFPDRHDPHLMHIDELQVIEQAASWI